MPDTKVLVLVGSLRSASINRQLAELAIEAAPDGVDLRLFDRLGELPFYNEDIDAADVAEPVAALREAAAGVDAALVVTPEYNGSIPGVLKNAIDHASRPYGQSAWAGKPAGIIGASIGNIGTAVAQQHLRGVLAYLDMPALGQPEVFLRVDDEFFDGNGDIANAETKKFLQGWVDTYAAWVKRLVA